VTNYYVAYGPEVIFGEYEDQPPQPKTEFIETFGNYRAFKARLSEVQSDLQGVLREARKSAPPAKPRDYLPWYRWRKETGGVTLENGQVIRTTRESQGQLTSAVNSVNAGLVATPIRWKLEGGVWVDLSAEELNHMASVVSDHVRACFAAEEVVEASLEGITTSQIPALFDAAYEEARTV
jgi:hypothetical protein